jgi:RNA polymerase sigma factor (sigma-70 family)
MSLNREPQDESSESHGNASPPNGFESQPSAEENEEFDRLLSDAALGSEEAQQAIVQRYAKEIRIVAKVLLGPQLRQHLDSMDLVQSVHRSILVGLRMERYRFSGPDKLIALACTILRRKVANKWRHLRRQVSFDKSPNGDPSSLSQILSEISNRETDPSLIAQYNDQLKDLCSHLSHEDRLMLEMRLDGFSNQEMAEELGLHPVALRVRWTRLRKRLHSQGISEELI